MRRSMLMCLLPVVAAAPVTAQAFEGTVTMDLPSMSNTAGGMTYQIKGDKMAMSMTMGQNAGPMAGKEMRMIVDQGTGKMTMLIPMEMGGSKGMKMVVDMKSAANDHQADIVNTEIKPLGTSETIAGYKCDDYEIRDKGKVTGRMCATHDLGTFAYPSGSPMGGRSSTPAWARVLSEKGGFFPLKYADENGKTVIVVTSVKRGNVPADAFAIPEGYNDMSGMMSGRRGG